MHTLARIALAGVNGSKPENYVVTYVAEQAKITPAPATITVEQKTAVYGDELPELKAVESGVYSVDDLGDYTLTTQAVKGSEPKTYPVVIADGAVYDRNYKVTEVPSTLTITKRVVKNSARGIFASLTVVNDVADVAFDIFAPFKARKIDVEYQLFFGVTF